MTFIVSKTRLTPEEIKLRSKIDERVQRLLDLLPFSRSPNEHIDQEYHFENVLDVGCADGKLIMGMAYRLKIQQIYGVDIYPEKDFVFPVLPEVITQPKTTHSHSPLVSSFVSPFISPLLSPFISPLLSAPLVHPRMTYLQEYEGFIDLDDNSVDLAVTMMSIHHFQERDTSLGEIRRILKPNGFLFIREHDVDPSNSTLRKHIDDIHKNYLSTDRIRYITYDITGHYTSKDELTDLLALYDFELIDFCIYSEPNPQAIYHALYQVRKDDEN